MLNNPGNINLVANLITIITAISAFVSWFIAKLSLKQFLKFKSYIFLTSLSFWGISSGILLCLNIQYGIVATILLFGTIFLFGKNYQLLLNSIINTNSILIVSKVAIYNVLCETIQRICIALVDDSTFGGNDIRVSLFTVDWNFNELVMVGRYPVNSDYIPEIKYEIGRGTSGLSAERNTIVTVENLPSWDKDDELYIELLNNYNIMNYRIF